MRIAILQDDFPPDSFGGAGIIAFGLAQEMRRRGHEVLVLTTIRDSQYAGEFNYEGLRICRIATKYDLRFQAYVGLWNVPVVMEVKKILSTFKPDLVHAHNVHGYLSYRSIVVAKKLGAKVVLTGHDVMPFNYTKYTDFIDLHEAGVPSVFHYRVNAWQQFRANRFRYNPLRNVIIRHVLRSSVDRIVAVSKALSQALNENGIGNTRVIHNGIDAAAWTVSSQQVLEFKKKYALGDSVILFGGRLSGIKGGGKLLEAAEKLVRAFPDLQILIVGKAGVYGERLLKQAKKFGFQDRLIFTGWISGPELHTAYHAATLVVTPSLCFDSFPTVNLEAFACKKSVITTCFGGARELVEDGVSGYVVNPYHVSMLAEKIQALLTDRKKCSAFGENGFTRVRQDFSLTAQVDAYEKLFRSLLV